MKIRVEKRIEELTKANAVPAGDGSMKWGPVKAAVKDGNVKEWQVLGGGGRSFKEVPPTGAVLIGFRYAASANRTPDFFQAIYRGPKGEINGAAAGTITGRLPIQVTKAKAGYAVGAIIIRSGAWLDAIQPVFMKMTPSGVDPNDSYKGVQLLGGDGGKAMHPGRRRQFRRRHPWPGRHQQRPHPGGQPHHDDQQRSRDEEERRGELTAALFVWRITNPPRRRRVDRTGRIEYHDGVESSCFPGIASLVSRA